MGRLQGDFLARVEAFCDRVLDVVEALAPTPCPRRILEQIAASGTSIGANVFEADEAMSRPDFAKTLGIAIKELNETRFWIRLIGRRSWLPRNASSPFPSKPTSSAGSSAPSSPAREITRNNPPTPPTPRRAAGPPEPSAPVCLEFAICHLLFAI